MEPLLATAGGASAWRVLPFALLLLSIAVLPLFAPHWWHANRNKAIVSLLFGAPVAWWVWGHDPHAVIHTALEYGAFVALLGSLYVISGGIVVRGSLSGTPLANTGILALGAVLANVVGTTGASMLLIRPYLQANRERRDRRHLVVFFIFIVANVGGCLTPLGDPPLFLGFLRGVPFDWTLGLWKEWALLTFALLVVFNLYDQVRFTREDLDSHRDLEDEVQPRAPISIGGRRNFLLLAGVVGTVLACGFWVYPRHGETTSMIAQAATLSLLAIVSLVATPRLVRTENGFTWHPFVEIVIVFAGIFAAMIPALALLRVRGAALGIDAPWQFFWATGSLSAFLDNAPTYVAFLSMAQHLPDEVAGTSAAALAAISCGAVFFGALTYIGNGPNFMVKAIAEHSGVKMPSFFGYLAWSACVLLPLFLAVTLIFFV